MKIHSGEILWPSHPAELKEDVGRHGVDPHHEGGEGVKGQVTEEDAPGGASQQPV